MGAHGCGCGKGDKEITIDLVEESLIYALKEGWISQLFLTYRFFFLWFGRQDVYVAHSGAAGPSHGNRPNRRIDFYLFKKSL